MCPSPVILGTPLLLSWNRPFSCFGPLCFWSPCLLSRGELTQALSRRATRAREGPYNPLVQHLHAPSPLPHALFSLSLDFQPSLSVSTPLSSRRMFFGILCFGVFSGSVSDQINTSAAENAITGVSDLSTFRVGVLRRLAEPVVQGMNLGSDFNFDQVCRGVALGVLVLSCRVVETLLFCFGCGVSGVGGMWCRLRCSPLCAQWCLR